MNLASMQQDFRLWLTAAAPDAADRFGTQAVPGLAVYQNNYRAQLLDCLQVSFPRVREWMGDEAFVSAAADHIDSRPPHAFTLDAYADNFGDTLARLYPHNPDLHELAWIEHALSWAFVAADATPLTAAALADVDWDAAHMVLVPSFTIRTASTNAFDIWNALDDGTEVPRGEIREATGGLVVWRRQFMCVVRQVGAIERDALMHVAGNGSFSALCAHLVEQLGEDEGIARAGALLANWIGSDLLADIVSAAPQSIKAYESNRAKE